MELENLDIIGLVRGMGLTPEQLAALVQPAPPPAEWKEGGYENT